MTKFPFDDSRPKHRADYMTDERIEEILKSAHWGVLSTVSLDGEPYGMPISYVWDESNGNIVIHTFRQGHKLDNIAKDNRVCYTIVGSDALIADKFSAAYESLVVFGKMEEIIDKDEAINAAVIFCRKFAPKIVEGMEVEDADQEIDNLAMMIEQALDTMAIYRIVPEHIASKQRGICAPAKQMGL